MRSSIPRNVDRKTTELGIPDLIPSYITTSAEYFLIGKSDIVDYYLMAPSSIWEILNINFSQPN
jgi:hypothetical protein